jgi:hypothetical protein
MRTLAIICTLLAAGTGAAPAQAPAAQHAGRRPPLPREREIALARSAAPPAVSDSATIYVLGDSLYEVAVRGTNGNACFVSRDWMDSIEPHCFDAEGAATVLQMEILKVEQFHQGRSAEEADRVVADALASGRLRLPRRPVMSYMMSAEQWLIDDERHVGGHWHPHLMIYYPYITGTDLGLGSGDMKTAIVFDGGKPWASIMIPLRDFVQAAGGPASR